MAHHLLTPLGCSYIVYVQSRGARSKLAPHRNRKPMTGESRGTPVIRAEDGTASQGHIRCGASMWLSGSSRGVVPKQARRGCYFYPLPPVTAASMLKFQFGYDVTLGSGGIGSTHGARQAGGSHGSPK